MAEKRVFVPFSRIFTNIFVFFPLKIQVLKFWQYWKLEKSDFTQNMERKLNLFTLSHRKVLDLEIYLKILEIWTALPPEIQQIKFLRHLRIHTFIISDTLTRFRKLKFPNFGRKKSVRPFQQDFHQYFRFFPLKIQVLKFWQYWKLEKSDFTKNMERKLNLFTLSHRKVLDLEIYLKILEIWTHYPLKFNK